MQSQISYVVQKLELLSPERLAEVNDFIDFLQEREEDKGLRQDFAQASEAALAKIWDNDDDGIYDSL